jgi:hypothetical protein
MDLNIEDGGKGQRERERETNWSHAFDEGV